MASTSLRALCTRCRCRGCSGQTQWGCFHLCQRRPPTVCPRGAHGLPSAMQPAIAQRVRLSCMWPLGFGRPCDVLECDDAFDLLSCVYGRLFPLHICANVRRRRRRLWHRGQCYCLTFHSDDDGMAAFSRSALIAAWHTIDAVCCAFDRSPCKRKKEYTYEVVWQWCFDGMFSFEVIANGRSTSPAGPTDTSALV